MSQQHGLVYPNRRETVEVKVRHRVEEPVSPALPVGSSDGNILGDGHADEMDDEQESIYDAEELKGDPVEVHEENGQTERKQETYDQRHKRQPAAEFVRRFLADGFECSRISLGTLEACFVQTRVQRPPRGVSIGLGADEHRERRCENQSQSQRKKPLVLRSLSVRASMDQFSLEERIAIFEDNEGDCGTHSFVRNITNPGLKPVDDPPAHTLPMRRTKLYL